MTQQPTAAPSRWPYNHRTVAQVDRDAEIDRFRRERRELHAAEDAREPPPAEAFELLPTTGHNKPPETETMADTSDDRLRLLIERIERLEEEKKGIGDDIKDVYSEAKATGYDAKILRKVIAIRKMKPDDRNEFAQVLETYRCSLGTRARCSER